MGRLKGSKNKIKSIITVEAQPITELAQVPGIEPIMVIKRGRGRPPGKKNVTTLKSEALEIKEINTLLVDKKEIKREIRKLKKLKLQCRPGTAERLDLEHKIKDLKKKLTEHTEPEPLKEPIIKEILDIEEKYKLTPTFEVLEIDLNKYTVEQLKKHLECIKRKINPICP